MKINFVLALVFLLCASSFVGGKPKAPMFISEKSQRNHLADTEDTQAAFFGDVRIRNWPLASAECEKCAVEHKKIYLPQGPEIYVRILDSKHILKQLVVDAKRSFKMVGDWAFKITPHQEVSACWKSQCSLMVLNKAIELGGCAVYLHWLEVQKPIAHIADSQVVHFQVIVSCTDSQSEK